ncbi:MAG: hypothetical protein J6U54_24920 [Clostridiales bacterium]|nr:hypothetical protein [Clostridiales bacterium]
MGVVRLDPLDLSEFLDEIKQTYGDSVYNEVINYKGRSSSWGVDYRVSYSLAELIEYAKAHDNNLPIQMVVTIVREFSGDTPTGNFEISILQDRSTLEYAAIWTAYKNSSNVCYLSDQWRKTTDGTKWSQTGYGVFKAANIYVSGNTTPKTVNYDYPSGAISSDVQNYTVDFSNATISLPKRGIIPNKTYMDGTTNKKIWSSKPNYMRNNNSPYQPWVARDKGYNYYSSYDLTPAEEDTYMAYYAPIVFAKKTYDENTIDLKFGPSTDIYIPHRYKGEKGNYLHLLDTINPGATTFKNLTYSLDLDSGSFSNDMMQIPNSVFNVPGLIEAKIYGTGGQSSTVLKKFRFVVKELPETVTSLSLSSSATAKNITLNGLGSIGFSWHYTDTSNRPIIHITDEVTIRCMEVYSDSDPTTRYSVTGSNNSFVIPTTGYLGTEGVFHGLLRFGDGNSTDVVISELIWNFDT